jgi:Tfp pilus assembly protein PilZ
MINQSLSKDKVMGSMLFQAPGVGQKLSDIINDLTDDEKTNLLKILSSPVPREKRMEKRKRFLLPTNIVCKNLSFYSCIENLSEQGAYIKTDHLIPPGNELFLSFSILNFEFPVKLKAEVIWLSKHGIGIKFKPSSALSYRLAIEKLADAINPKPAKV